MSRINQGEQFIKNVSEAVLTKEYMADNYVSRYLMRAIMSGVLLGAGYVLYFAFMANFTNAGDEHIGKFLASGFFSFGLMCIYFTKSELLTSNMMITNIGRSRGIITIGKMTKILSLCLLGNFLGGLIIALLLGASSIITGDMAVHMANSIEVKQAYIIEGNWIDLFVRALLCNFFINLAMLIVYSGNIKSDVAKMIIMFYGVFIFLYLGLEHSVANMILFTIGAVYDIIHGTSMVILSAAALNVIIALIGNFVGGALCIGTYYSFLNNAKEIDDKTFGIEDLNADSE